MGLWLLRGSRRMSALASVAAVVLSACGQPTPPEPETLRLLQIRPENPLGVYLDEELVLHFSAPVDPTSVTHASLQVVDTAGRAARGRIVVEGAQVRFEPAPVLSATLVDGGFAPATDYELRVLGFPALDGVRSVEGAPLSTSVRLSLRTVQPGVDRRAFRPRLEERPRPLRFFPGPSADGRWPMGPLDSIYLDCDAPLDPSTMSRRTMSSPRKPDARLRCARACWRTQRMPPCARVPTRRAWWATLMHGGVNRVRPCWS